MRYELHTTLNYKIRIPYLICKPSYVSANIVITPDFVGYNQNILDDCVVFDIYDLIDSF